MRLIEVYEAATDDRNPETQVHELVGKPVPFAFVPNYKCYGYAKFKLDKQSLKAFEQKLDVIQNP